MKLLIKAFLLLLIITNIGCDNESESITINDNKLIGYWVNPVSIDSELKFERANSLKKEAYGVSFLTDSKCIERSSGWCGTPPITFFDSQGTWTKKDSIITIILDNGLEGFKWEIKTLNENYLIIERLQ